jgi:Rod binding domain-containing protein
MPQPISKPYPMPPAGYHLHRRRMSDGASRPLSETPVAPELKAACQEMESLFIHHMLTEMRKTVTKSGLTDGGRSEEIYTSLMDAEVAKQMAASGGLGLAKVLEEQMNASAAASPKKSRQPRF